MPPHLISSSEDNEEEDLNRILADKFTSDFRTGYVSVDGHCLPEYYADFADRIENLEVRDDDVWVCSFPKTGTTWTQEMVWCIANDMDFEGAKVVLPKRFPFLEHSTLFDYRTILPLNPGLKLPEFALDSVKYVNDLPSPRFIKTHLPYNLLPRQIRNGDKKPKIIYVARNPKDTCVSYYHHCKLLEGYRGDFDEFCRLFLAGKLCFAPFWKHIMGYWNVKNDRDNVLFIKYEDMKQDLTTVIRQTSDFLGEHRKLNDKEVDILAEHLSFANMKANPAVNYEEVVELNKKFKLIQQQQSDGQFMRIGQVNQWKGKMSDETIERFDRWISENLNGCGFNF